MNKDLKKFALEMAVKGLVIAAPIFISGLTEFIKDGGAYDIVETKKKS